MKVKNEISEELRSLSTVIDGISRDIPQGEPYVVPVGYFNDFPDLMMMRIGGARLPEKGEASAFHLPEKGEVSSFQVPEGYFEGLAAGIMNRIKQGQSRDIPEKGLSGDIPGNSWLLETSGEVASGEVASEEVAEELVRLSPLLGRIDRKSPYQAPEGYFDGLVPVLAGLQDKPLYKIPEGYFEGLAAEIAAKLSQPALAPLERLAPVERQAPAERPAPARVISMRRKRGWWRYSAAAVVAGLVLTIGWLRLHTAFAPSGTNLAKTVNMTDGLVKLSDQDIQNYLDTDNLPLAESVTNSTATLDIDDNAVNNLLGEVPDGELKQYMEEHGGAKDIATN